MKDDKKRLTRARRTITKIAEKPEIVVDHPKEQTLTVGDKNAKGYEIHNILDDGRLLVTNKTEAKIIDRDQF
jgi:hypothetical protein